MKFNDENKNILFSKRAFSNVLEALPLKLSQTPNFQPHNYDRLYCHIVFHPLVKVFDILEFQTLILVST